MSFSSKHCESDFSEERLDDHSPTGEIMCEKECSPNSKKVLSFDKSAQEQSNSVSSTDNNVQSESPVLENYETKLDTMNMDVNKSEDTEDQKSVCNAECSHSRKEGDEINQNVIKNVPEEASENQVLNDSELKLSAVIEELKNLEIEEIFAPKIVPETDFNEELQQTNKIICAGNKATVSCETELCSSENIQKDMHEESNDVPETLAQSTVEDAVTQDMNKSEVIGHDASDTETVEEENESCKMKVQIRRSENFAYEICSDTDSDDELQMTNFICAENKATVSSETEQGCSEKNLQQDMHEESNDVPEILAQSTDEDEVSPSANKGDHDCFDTSPAKEKDQSYKMKIKRRAANVKSLESFRSLRITSPTPSSSKQEYVSNTERSPQKKRTIPSDFLLIPTPHGRRIKMERLRIDDEARLVLTGQTPDQVELTNRARCFLNEVESKKYRPNIIKKRKIVRKSENVLGAAVGPVFEAGMEAFHAGVPRENPEMEIQQEGSQQNIVQLGEQRGGEQNNDQLHVQDPREEINENFLQAQESSEQIDEKLPFQEYSDSDN